MIMLSNSEDVFIQTNSSNDCDVNATIALHSQWIYEYFGDCVVEMRQYFAFSVGILSIVCWIFALFPQIVENCKKGEADKSLSFWFLLLWLVSDSANLIGAILTNQLTMQVAVAAYFVFIDVINFVQFLFYYFRNRRLRGLKKPFKPSYGTVVMILISLLPTVAYFSSPQGHHHHRFSPPQGHHYHRTKWMGRHLLEYNDPIIDVHDTKFILGWAFGWLSAIVYFFALPSQIIKNFIHGSVEGVSLMMSVFITLGDFTYVFSILLFSIDKVFLIRTLPWILGSSWSFFFDVILLIQILIYKCRSSRKTKAANSTLQGIE